MTKPKTELNCYDVVTPRAVLLREWSQPTYTVALCLAKLTVRCNGCITIKRYYSIFIQYWRIRSLLFVGKYAKVSK